MATVYVQTEGQLDVGGRVYRFGSQQRKAHTVTAGNVRDAVLDVDPSTTVLVFSDTVDLPSTFSFLVLETDQDLMMEFVTDDDASIGEEFYTMELKVGVPFVLGSDSSYAGATVNFAAGTLDTIDTIRVRNLGASAAVLRVLMVD